MKYLDMNGLQALINKIKILLNGKQNKLVLGNNLSFGSDGKLNAVDTKYTKPSSEPISYISGLQSALDSKQAKGSYASSTHTHAISNISNLQSTLDGKVDKVSGKNLSTNDFTSSYKSKLDGIASGANKTFVDNSLTSTSTTNALSAKQGKALNDKINAGLSGKQNKLVAGKNISIDTKTNTISATDTKYTKPSSEPISYISGLQAELNKKANKVHTHAIADVTRLQDALNNRAIKSHKHDVADLSVDGINLEPWLQNSFITANAFMIEKRNLTNMIDKKADKDHTHDSIEADLSGTPMDLKFVVTDKATYTGMTKDQSTLYFVQE